jgi:putative ABC transport system permease protein
MMVVPLIGLAWQALWANKLRSGLTLLGVVVGFTSVMTIISALEGMMGAIEDDLARLGPTTFIVQKWGIVTSEEQWLEVVKRKPFDKETGELISEGCELCETVAYSTGTGTDNVQYRGTNIRDVRVSGTTADYIDIVDLEVSEGRFHSFEDDMYRRHVAFIGDAVRERLYEGLDPIGRDVRIDGVKYTIIGVAKKQGGVFGGDERDSFIMIPFETFSKHYGFRGDRMNYFVKAQSLETMDQAMDEVRMILRAKRHVPYDKPDDFAILTADNILEFLNSVTRMFRLGLVGVSSVSVVVGGIVVMNIMMVSVSERTREIGIRKSVGAKQSHILTQFLFEALITTFSGGLIGIIAGFLVAKSLVGMIDVDISPSGLAITLGLSISVGIGVIFGIYPAMKAARLDPIKALSYE